MTIEPTTARRALKTLLVDETEGEALKRLSLDMPSVTLSQRQLCDIELMMNGGFTPLDGFMDREAYEHVVDSMRLPGGELWPIPVTLDVSRELAKRIEPGSRIALRDQEGLILAVLDVAVAWEPDKRVEAERVYGTTSARHPGVRHLRERIGDVYVGGRVRGFSFRPTTTTRSCATRPRSSSGSSTGSAGGGSSRSTPPARCTSASAS